MNATDMCTSPRSIRGVKSGVILACIPVSGFVAIALRLGRETDKPIGAATNIRQTHQDISNESAMVRDVLRSIADEQNQAEIKQALQFLANCSEP
jgi:hypothetical protein